MALGYIRHTTMEKKIWFQHTNVVSFDRLRLRVVIGR